MKETPLFYCRLFHRKEHTLPQIEYGSAYVATCRNCGLRHIQYRN